MHSSLTSTTHLAFADKAHCNTGRYRAIGLVTLGAQHQPNIERMIQNILTKHGVTSELKSSQIDRGQDRDEARDLLRTALRLIAQDQLRVDVLIWDIEDSRHKVPRRDDLNNLQRLLYHICKVVLTQRWPAEACWAIYPDQQDGIDWQALHRMLRLGIAGWHRQRPGQLLEPVTLLRIAELRPVSSADTPISMLADLLAGLATFAYEQWSTFRDWRQEQRGQIRLPLATESDPASQISKRTLLRFAILDAVLAACSRHGLDAALDTSRGLRTKDPACRLNFWRYTPQGAYDRAPVKPKRQTGDGSHLP
ncbi:hypothetical protein OO015_12315 [Thermomicrobium sp. 4228-Ro]|uniref:hypothetical protein n=1 Tax=Thermomicrobium sp. 4228-Ro TaxID=2993937 RepID=UPI0022495939|nr:hypothetical protein [Thermomicrobium sp. 4228-Ro]MCX2728274.1 hypothetical protein [Thermomicrobium sp. 4228-Ro]